jgi:uncharacterized sporulation protein YeaH/YhbH (DUF444 family)
MTLGRTSIIDRRLNPKSRSLGNRQRFVRRAKSELREAVNEAIRKRGVTSIDGKEPVRARLKGLKEPAFGLDPRTGERDFVVPGNKIFRPGDRIPKPEGGGGGGGSEGSPDGEGEDDFVFTLTREEFLDIFFEDLALPDMLKRKLKQEKSETPMRAGYMTEGPPAQLSYGRTMKNSLARRIALKRPSQAEIEEKERERDAAEAAGDDLALARLEAELATLRRRRVLTPYLDPLDLRYRRFEHVPKPSTQAVMFCLMDASASMTEPLKDLAKRFFMLLYLFLTREYEQVQVVFIRHTTTAREVDEETFFRGADTGGTVVSTALEKMREIIEARFPVDEWNIYAAQASDGHDFSDDLHVSTEMLAALLPKCQYFAYVEVSSPHMMSGAMESALWGAYTELAHAFANFAMRRISAPEEILPVFRRLFARHPEAA